MNTLEPALTLAEKCRGQQPEFAVWKSKSAACRDQLCMAPCSTPWTQRPGVQLVGVPKSDRVRDVLDVRYGAARKAGRPGMSAQEIA